MKAHFQKINKPGKIPETQIPAEHYKLLFEKSPIPLLVLDGDLTIVTATDGYLAATKRTIEELHGKHIFDAFPDNPQDAAADGVKRLHNSLMIVLKDRKPHSMPVQKYDIPRPAAEGGGFEVRYWNPQNVPVLDSQGEVLYIIHRVDDVTNLVLAREKEKAQADENSDLQQLNRDMAVALFRNNKSLEQANEQLRQSNSDLTEKTEELRRSNQELAYFASTASHDIQAPFRIVGNYLALVEEKLRAKGTFAEFSASFERIFKARERINSLLDDLLTFAMVAKNDRFLEDVDAGELVKEVLQNLEGAIKDRNATVDVQNPLPVITGEKIQLMQVFQNLIGNALKYNRGQPYVEVFAQERRSEWLFGVRDNGFGIPADFHKKIFEVFQRLNNREEFPGTGLGLSICKRIVEHHDGHIWVESENGKGSTFYFTVSRNLR